MNQILDGNVLEGCTFEDLDFDDDVLFHNNTTSMTPNSLLLGLHYLQTEGAEQFPADSMDSTDDFDLRLIGVAEDGTLNEVLLKKLMAQLTDGALGQRVKVCLLCSIRQRQRQWKL